MKNVSTTTNKKISNDKKGEIEFLASKEIPNARLLNALEESEKIHQGKTKTKRYNSFEELVVSIDDEEI